MEEFESSSVDTWESWGAIVEKSREQSEKQKESYKKAQAQIQKTQKDEKKAQWDNEGLFLILERFIQNPYYEEFIPSITELLKISIPSRFIIFFISLFYPEASLHMLRNIWREKDIDLLLSLHREGELVDFSENHIHPTIRKWMSVWVHSGQVYLTDVSMSIIMQNKLLSLIRSEKQIPHILTQWLTFFFLSRNIQTHTNVMESYAKHILSEFDLLLSKSLVHSDDDIIYTPDFEDSTFFWLSS